MSPKLNLFLIGASKAGTTTLWDVLAHHPDVSMGKIKEPCIFSFTDWERRERELLRDYDPQARWRGEASTVYSETHLFPSLPSILHAYNPDARILYVVREPLDRLYSVWRQTLYTGHHNKHIYRAQTDRVEVPLMPRSLSKAVWEYPSFIEACRYYLHLTRYQAYFPPSQILLLFYEDLKNNPDSFYRALHSFLDLRPVADLNTGLWKNRGEGKRVQNPSFWHHAALRLGIHEALHARPKVHAALSRLVRPGISPDKRLTSRQERKIKSHLADDTANILRVGGKPSDFWSIRA